MSSTGTSQSGVGPLAHPLMAGVGRLEEDDTVGTITDQQYAAAYPVAAAVFNGKMQTGAGAKQLRDQHAINVNSARDIIRAYAAMRRGTLFQHGMSASATDLFLSQIERDFGERALKAAVEALRLHIAYNERVSSITLRSLRAVMEKHASDEPLDLASVEEFFYSRVKEALADSRARRLRRLNTAPAQPEKRVAFAVIYERNPDVVAEVLYRARGRCELCSKEAPFKRSSDQTPYLEVHHVVRLADGGADTVKNAVALCPNCHRETHFGGPGLGVR